MKAETAKAISLEGHLLDQVAHIEKGSEFFWHRVRTHIVFYLIGRFSKSKDAPAIVDVGAGAGVFGYHLKRYYPKSTYAFIEPIQSLAENLRKLFGSQSDWTQREVLEADAITCLDVLEHIEDDVSFLSSYRLRMQRDALLIVTVPALPYLWSEWDQMVGHHRRYTATRLREISEQAGFEVLDVRYAFQSMIVPGLLRKLKNKRQDAEFPQLPLWVNRFLTRAIWLEYRLFSWLPFGTSAVIALRKP